MKIILHIDVNSAYLGWTAVAMMEAKVKEEQN